MLCNKERVGFEFLLLTKSVVLSWKSEMTHNFSSTQQKRGKIANRDLKLLLIRID